MQTSADTNHIAREALDSLPPETMRAIGSYDAYCKRQLARKPVLARLLKSCIPEFAGCSVEDIEHLCLVQDPVIEGVPTDADDSLASMVRCLNGDDASPTEGNVEFDLLVRPLLPQGGGSAAVIVNLEPQDDWDPGYPLLARASYYCARLLSSQKVVEFLHSDYGDLKKVYSVWVLTSPPGRLRGVAQRTRVVWDCLAGDPQTDVEADLGVFEHACALVVGLTGTDPGDYTGIIGLLDALLAKDMDPRDRARIITDGYGIPGADIGREAGTMGSIGTQIALKALREGVGASRKERQEGW